MSYIVTHDGKPFGLRYLMTGFGMTTDVDEAQRYLTQAGAWRAVRDRVVVEARAECAVICAPSEADEINPEDLRAAAEMYDDATEPDPDEALDHWYLCLQCGYRTTCKPQDESALRCDDCRSANLVRGEPIAERVTP